MSEVSNAVTVVPSLYPLSLILSSPAPVPDLAQLIPAPVQGADARLDRADVQVVDPWQVSGWDDLVQSLPGATFFHGASWARVLSRSYGHRPQYFVWGITQRRRPDSRGQRVEGSIAHSTTPPRYPLSAIPCSFSSILALCPMMELRGRFTGRHGISLPFSDHCSRLSSISCPTPYTPYPSSSISSGLWSTILDHGRRRGWRYVEVRGGPAPAPEALASATCYGHELDLRDGEAGTFERFAPPVRRAIRKAERSGLNVSLSHTLDALHDFYVLHRRTRRRHGLLPEPFSFFLNLHDAVIARGGGFIALARQGLKPVAAAIFLHLGRHAVFKFGASDEGLVALRANHLVMWESIRGLVSSGFRTLDLGRTSTAQEGLRRFRLGWGTREGTTSDYRYDLQQERFVTAADLAAGWHDAVLSRLPRVVNWLVGRVMYPHLGCAPGR
jgi:hypothetical protein